MCFCETWCTWKPIHARNLITNTIESRRVLHNFTHQTRKKHELHLKAKAASRTNCLSDNIYLVWAQGLQARKVSTTAEWRVCVITPHSWREVLQMEKSFVWLSRYRNTSVQTCVCSDRPAVGKFSLSSRRSQWCFVQGIFGGNFAQKGKRECFIDAGNIRSREAKRKNNVTELDSA